jgi:hypothetical protein
MTSLQKVVLGTPPTAVDGDTVRTANTKANANVDVLNTQAALTSATGITTAQALTSAHIGKRINIALAAAGVINLPSASTCTADSVLHLRNTGTTVVTLGITAGSGDTVALSKINPGESVLLDTDGAHAWNVLMRGRTNSDNETVNGNCTVIGNETVGGTLTASGDVFRSGTAGTSRGVWFQTAASNRWFVYAGQDAESGSNAGSTLYFARYSDTGAYVDAPLSINRATGVVATTLRPTFAGNTPWDSGNFTPTNYAALASANAFTASATFGGTAWIGATLSARNSANTYAVSAYASNQTAGAFIARTDNASIPLMVWCFGSTVVGTVTTNGTTTSYGTTSDYRLKTNYAAIANPVATLARIKFYEGEFNAAPGTKAHYVLAHELQEVLDYAVSGAKDAVNEDGEIVPQLVDYSKLVPLLGAALQVALQRIAALEGK